MKKGWERIPIAAFAKTGAGGTPLKSHKGFYEGGDIPWLMSGEVANANICEAKNYITKAGLAGSSAKLFPPDSVLVAMYGATAGEVGVLRFEAATNQAVCAIFPSRQHVPEFLYYYLLFAKDRLVSQAIGNAQPNISQEKIKRLEIPLPPLPEQKRIVEVLDKAFEGLAAAKANAEANLENAGILMALIRDLKFEALRTNSRIVPLGDVCDFENGDRGKNYPGKQHRTESGVPFINAGHLSEDGIDFSAMDYISPKRFALLGNGKIRPSDILFCLRGSLGKFASVGGLEEGAIASSLVIMRPSKELRADYLLCYLASGLSARMIDKYKGGAAQPNLGAKDLRRFEIPLPPIDEQQDIAARLGEFQKKTKAAANFYSEKLKAEVELKQSLLQKAFAGELT